MVQINRNLIERCLVKHGISKNKFAKMLGISPKTLKGYLKSGVCPENRFKNMVDVLDSLENAS